MAINLTFDPILSRVRIAGTGLSAGTALFERSYNNLSWETVRGGSEVAIVAGAAALDDYEFRPGVLTYYRIDDGTDLWASTITVDQPRVWLKSIARPFLNRAVTVQDHTDIVLAARNGVFPIVDRSNPVGVTDVRLARQWTMTIQADSVSDADAIELVLAAGDPMFIQVPEPSATDVPGGYVLIGDVTRRRFGHTSARRWFDLPCTTVAAPGPGVVGSTMTWAAVLAGWANWSDVISEFDTWADLAEYVASPDTVIVP